MSPVHRECSGLFYPPDTVGELSVFFLWSDIHEVTQCYCGDSVWSCHLLYTFLGVTAEAGFRGGTGLVVST